MTVPTPIYMRPKNWWRYQVYQDGRPITWIKNHLELDEPGSKFSLLSLADQGRLQKLWRLAGRLPNGCIPYDEQYIRRHLGDKRFPIASHLVTNWFAVGTQMELKKAAQKEKRSRKNPRNSTLEQRKQSREVRVKGSALKHPPVEEPDREPVGSVAGWEGLPVSLEKEQELAKILPSLRDVDDTSMDALRRAADGVAFGRCRKVRESVESRRPGTYGVGYAVNALRSEAREAAAA